MATNEGLQPVSKDQVPVDPNVRIPDHVRRAAETAEAIHQQAYTQPAPAEEQPPQPEPPPQPDPPQPEAQPPRDETVTAEEWHHRYLSMQGRFRAAQQTIGSMEQQMAELGQELVRTQNMLAQQQAQPPAHERSQPDHNNLITAEDRANYGDELLDLTRRVALSTVAPELADLRAENQRLTNQVRSGTRRELFTTLDGKLPQWRQINQDVRFKSWLRLPNVYTGQIRGEMLKAAVDGAEAPKVLALFRDFLMEAQATGQMAPAPQAEQQTAQTQQPAPRQPAVNLETLAAPGRARPASGDTQVPSEKPIYTRAQIAKFYDDSRKGLYAGRQAEYDATQADLTRAQAEGRIR